MTSIGARLAVLSLITGLAVLTPSQAQERKIKREELPPAVEKTVSEQSRGATIKGFSTEIDKSKRLYEVELTANGHSKDISMDRDGKIVEVEEEVAMDSLSPEVKAALTRAAGSGAITKVESLTKTGKLVAYEGTVKHGPKHSEVQVGPNGEKLAHEE
ncbi:MAG TPA: hypothetical protein VFE02_12500 [Candidatus Acidoferrales bacterium]|nr:hypothetical protein [Candidatus Acidoferrales bacterium]